MIKSKDLNRSIKKISLILLISIVLIMQFSIFVTSAPPPIVDVEGVIIDTNGLEPITKQVYVSLTNINTSKVTSGQTSSFNPSYFKISGSGEINDILTLRVWNREHETRENLTITGDVIRTETINLDMNIENNYAPDFTSLPSLTVIEDEEYSYQIEATDENDDSISFSIVSAPNSMELDSETNTITWTPLQTDVNEGSYEISLLASDGSLDNYQNFTLSVENTNDAPEFTSYPVLSGKENEAYLYDANATDEDSDPVTYSLLEYPSGMVINETSGVISWTPIEGERGEYNIEIAASDGTLETSQTYILSISSLDNSIPVFISTPETIAYVNQVYTYQIISTDDDGDNVLYSLYTGPETAYIDLDEKLYFSVLEEHLSLSPILIIIRAIDQNGGVGSQRFFLNISNETIQNNQAIQNGGGDSLPNNPIGLSNNKSIEKEYKIISPTNEKVSGESIILTYVITNFSINNIEIVFKKETNISQDLMIKELSSLDKMPGVGRFVYKYFDIKLYNNESRIINATISFNVPKVFLAKLNTSKEKIALLRLHEGKWDTLETIYTNEDEENYKFSSITPGFSIFAISFDEKIEYPDTKTYKKTPTTSSTDKIKITGRIYTSAKLIQVQKFTKFTITHHETSRVYNSFTGVFDNDNSGSFISNIKAKVGDTITIKVYEDEFAVYEKSFKITDSEMELNVYTDIAPKKSQTIAILIIMISTIILVTLSIWYYKKRKITG